MGHPDRSRLHTSARMTSQLEGKEAKADSVSRDSKTSLEEKVDVSRDPRRRYRISASNVGRITGSGYNGRDWWTAALLALQLEERKPVSKELQKRFSDGHKYEPLGVERIQAIMDEQYPGKYESIYACSDLTQRCAEYPFLKRVGKEGALHRPPWFFFHVLADAFLFERLSGLLRRLLELKFGAAHPDAEVPTTLKEAGLEIYIAQLRLQCFIAEVDAGLLVKSTNVNTRRFLVRLEEEEWRATDLVECIRFYRCFLAWRYEDDAKESLAYTRRFLEAVNADPDRKTKIDIDAVLSERASDEEKKEVKELYAEEKIFSTVKADYGELPVKKSEFPAQYARIRLKHVRAFEQQDNFVKLPEALSAAFGHKSADHAFVDNVKPELKRIQAAFERETKIAEAWEPCLEFVCSKELPFVGEWIHYRLADTKRPLLVSYMSGYKSRKGRISQISRSVPYYRDPADLMAGLLCPEVFMVLINDDDVHVFPIKRTDKLMQQAKKRALSIFESYFAWFWLGRDDASEGRARELLGEHADEALEKRASLPEQKAVRASLS